MINELINLTEQDGFLRAAKQDEKAAYVKDAKTNRDYAKERFLQEENASVDALTKDITNDLFTAYRDRILNDYVRDTKRDQRSLQDATSFLNPAFDDFFKMVPGQLVAVCAYTGQGKTTSAVNIAATYIENGKRPLIISNEEFKTDIYNGVACVLLGLDPLDHFNGDLLDHDRQKLMTRVLRLIRDKELMVIDTELSGNGTTKSETVLKIVEDIEGADVSFDVCVIDYLTNIYAAGSTSTDGHYFQIEKFLSDMKNLINKVSFPVVIAAQMHSSDKKTGKALDARLIMGGAINRFSTVVIEVKPYDTVTGITEYEIHKNRRFKKKGTLELMYDKGRMVEASAELRAGRLSHEACTILNDE